MRRQLLTGLIMLGRMTALLGIVYPLAVTGVAQLAFGNQANGSILDSDGGESDGVPVASALIGQPADGPEWFHPRPSAAGDGYDGAASAGASLVPSPVIATRRPPACSARISSIFCSGVASAR